MVVQVSEDKNKKAPKVISGLESASKPLKVFIEIPAMQKIQYFTQVCPCEISGLGLVEYQDNKFTITDVFLVKQVTAANGSFVELDSQALNHLIYTLVRDGRDPSQLKFQWHSHAHSRVFFSPTDVATIRGYMNDFMISAVVNKRGDCRTRLDIFKPLELSLEVDLEVKVPPLLSERAENCLQEIRDNVRIVLPKKSRRSRQQASKTDNGILKTTIVS